MQRLTRPALDVLMFPIRGPGVAHTWGFGLASYGVLDVGFVFRVAGRIAGRVARRGGSNRYIQPPQAGVSAGIWGRTRETRSEPRRYCPIGEQHTEQGGIGRWFV